MEKITAARRAILLDALGTLVALQPPVPRLRSELARRFGIEISDAQASRAISAEIEYYRTHLDEGRDVQSLQALRSRCAEALRAALPAGRALAAVANHELTDALLASLQFTAFPDAAPALSAWRGAGLRIVVVSNWDVSLHDVLATVSLAPLTDAILTSAEAGARKPSPAIFDQGLRLAGCAAPQAVHVGDSVEEDVAGARAAGIEPILVSRRGGASVAGVRTIASLTEFDP